ncbi:magnesium transporter [Geranomyces variabilis]|nr:magnesium transporter [Geranomyces variabilis]KAJ3135707.1 Magnesium transporter nipa1 [Geranomyces variabilis]
MTRVRDRSWVIGVLLTYLGEACGNWVALSFVSAAVVTPLGIVAVIVNAVLANRYCGERFGRSQVQGYVVVAAGVLIVLFAAPKDNPGASYAGTSTRDVLNDCCATRSFALGLGLLVSVAASMVAVLLAVTHGSNATLIRKSKASAGKHFMALHVLACSVLGGITISCGKVLSIIARKQAEGVADSKAPAVPHSSAASAVFPLICILALLVVSIAATEYVRQQAYARYPVSRFQPLVYAGINGVAVLSSVILFRELPTAAAFLRFAALFAVGMTVIVTGLKIAQGRSAPTLQKGGAAMKTARRG